MAQELYTTHDGTDGFNLTGGGFLFDYFSYSTPGQMEEGDQYVHFFPFYNRVTVIPISQDYTASYYYPIYTSMFSSSLFNMSVMISGHPEYGAYVKDGIIWGPDFDIWPRYSWQTSELHILKPSASLLAYIKSMVELTPVSRKSSSMNRHTRTSKEAGGSLAVQRSMWKTIRTMTKE